MRDADHLLNLNPHDPIHALVRVSDDLRRACVRYLQFDVDDPTDTTSRDLYHLANLKYILNVWGMHDVMLPIMRGAVHYAAAGGEGAVPNCTVGTA